MLAVEAGEMDGIDWDVVRCGEMGWGAARMRGLIRYIAKRNNEPRKILRRYGFDA